MEIELDDAPLDDESGKPYIDQETIGEYLEMMNDFIKNSIPDEMYAYRSRLQQDLQENLDPNK